MQFLMATWAARNFERDDGSVQKEFYIREIISLENN